MNSLIELNNLNKKSLYFKKREIALWSGSVILIVLSFLIFDRSNGLTLIASLIGVTSLIFCAKGNPVGQVLMIVFSIFMCLLTVAVTVVFYFILEYFHTANMVPSTVSIATSFAAAYLTFRRSPYFALVYGMNDVVLIVLWVLAAMEETRYLSVVVCFIAFFVNDLYGYISWKKMEKRQDGGR